jgi:hypothetical protein
MGGISDFTDIFDISECAIIGPCCTLMDSVISDVIFCSLAVPRM